MKWAFEEQDIVGIERLYAETFARNGASCRVLEKVRMKEEGHLRSHSGKWDEYVDVGVYGLLREEWEKEIVGEDSRYISGSITNGPGRDYE